MEAKLDRGYASKVNLDGWHWGEWEKPAISRKVLAEEVWPGLERAFSELSDRMYEAVAKRVAEVMQEELVKNGGLHVSIEPYSSSLEISLMGFAGHDDLVFKVKMADLLAEYAEHVDDETGRERVRKFAALLRKWAARLEAAILK